MYQGFVGTFFSHCLSLVSSLWAIFSVSDGSSQPNASKELYWIRLSILLVIANSCLALIRYGNSSFGYKLRKLHVVTLNLSTVVSFTIIEIIFHSIYRSPKFLILSPLLNIISFISNVFSNDYRTKTKVTDSFIAVNCMMFCVTSLLEGNYFSVALGSSYIFGYFVVGECGFLFDTELPSIDAYQYLTCFLNIFAVNAFSF